MDTGPPSHSGKHWGHSVLVFRTVLPEGQEKPCNDFRCKAFLHAICLLNFDKTQVVTRFNGGTRDLSLIRIYIL